MLQNATNYTGYKKFTAENSDNAPIHISHMTRSFSNNRLDWPGQSPKNEQELMNTKVFTRSTWKKYKHKEYNKQHYDYWLSVILYLICKKFFYYNFLVFIIINIDICVGFIFSSNRLKLT